METFICSCGQRSQIKVTCHLRSTCKITCKCKFGLICKFNKFHKLRWQVTLAVPGPRSIFFFFQHKLPVIGKWNVWKRKKTNWCCYFQTLPTTGQNLNYFYLHIWKISKVIYKKTLSGIYCMKPVRAFVTSACWSYRIASSFTGAGVLHDRDFL